MPARTRASATPPPLPPDVPDVPPLEVGGVAGKRVLISGGATGIGRATARVLATRGARVLIFALKAADVNRTVREISGAGGEIYGLAADQSRSADVKRVFGEVDRRLGGLDVLMNNAATYAGTVADSDERTWRRVIDTNILGYMACCSEALRRMARNAGGKRGRGGKAGGDEAPPIAGHIVNIGSMSADVREEGSDLYVATKAAVQAFSEALRKEVNRRGVKVTLVEPGLVGTPLTRVAPQRQRKMEQAMTILEPTDIAEAVYFCLTRPPRCDVVNIQVRPHMQII